MIPALSIRQPWCHAILHYGKTIENRRWATRYRGPIFLHASKNSGKAEFEEAAAFIASVIGSMPLARSMVEFGGIIGRAEIVDCVESSSSPWFAGRYGFVLDNVEPLSFRPCKGALGLFDPDHGLPTEYVSDAYRIEVQSILDRAPSRDSLPAKKQGERMGEQSQRLGLSA